VLERSTYLNHGRLEEMVESHVDLLYYLQARRVLLSGPAIAVRGLNRIVVFARAFAGHFEPGHRRTQPDAH
jgi:hypothetical protein